MRVISLYLIAAMLVPCLMMAQRTNSTISGTITDPSGANVPGADVTATEVSTGAVAKAVSNSSGFYILANLAPGGYKLTVEGSGFRTYIQTGIVLNVDQTVTINVNLTLGAVTQEVTVTGQAAQVDTRSQTLGYQITPSMTVELPLNGRNIQQLMILAPDAGPTLMSGYQQSASRPENSGINFGNYVAGSGGRGDSTAYYLDGALDEDALTQVANIYPNPDAIQEFSFETNNYNAKFGGRGGGVMNAVTKGGTDQFHGDAFEFVRYYSMNARSFFASTQDGLKRNQFGGTFGGPIQKDKTFFFFSYQRMTLRSVPSENTAITPTQAELNGNWSSTSTQLVSPSTGQAFAGNQVSTSLYDPIATKILALVPVANATTGIAQYRSITVENDNQYLGRMDHLFGQKFRLYGSYIFDGLAEPSTSIPTDVLTATANQYWRSQFAALNAAWTISPTLVANFAVSVSRRRNSYTGPAGFPTWTTLGANVPNLTSTIGGGPRTSLDLSISGYFSTFWDSLYTIPAIAGDLVSNWTWIKGKHTLEFGGEVEKTKVVKDQDYLGDGSYTYAGALSGNNLLDFMLGYPSAFTQESNYAFVPQTLLPALYAQDTWKVLRKLTLILGVRWNPFVPVKDTEFHEQYLFSQQWYNAGTHSTLYPNLPPGLLVLGDPGVPSRDINSVYHLLDPRLGFAYDVFGNGKTSIRGGYSMYQDQMTANTINPENPPFSDAVSFTYPYSTANPYNGHVDPFPIPTPTPSNTVFPLPIAANPYAPYMPPPTIQQWNFTIEQQLPWNAVLRVGYEGENAYHLFGAVPYNYAIYNPSETRAQNLATTAQRRPLYPNYQNISLGQDIGTSAFNGLVVSLDKRMSKSFAVLAGYRWAKCINEAWEAFFDTYAYTSPNPAHDRGLCQYDVRNELHLSYVWDLPKAPSSLGFVGKHVLSGWVTTGLLTLQSGQPFSVSTGADYSLTGIGSDRADIIGNPNLPSGRPKAQQLGEWFNTAAYQTNALGTYGDSGRDSLIGPGLTNVDFSLIKSIPIKKGPAAESQHLDFRAEFFNIFNWVNFSNPTANLSSSANGKITAVQSTTGGRVVQLALKLYF